jgi:hypothetical protein
MLTGASGFGGDGTDGGRSETDRRQAGAVRLSSHRHRVMSYALLAGVIA